MKILLLLLVILPGAVGQGENFDPSGLASDLRCSACTNFITDYLAQCAKIVTVSGDAVLYTQMLRDIYAEHAPSKLASVASLLKRSKGKEYELYLKVCDKYNIEPEEPSEEPSDDEIFVHKRGLAHAAIGATVAGIKPSTQWATVGETGSRKFVDFNKAMQTGSMSGSMNMGPETLTQLLGSYKFYAQEHGADLANAVARVARVYESKLDKEFCVGIEHCGGGKKEL